MSMKIGFLAFTGLFAVGLVPVMAATPTISVVIPAKKPSRPAHFNWSFTSKNGKPVQVGQFACGSYWVAPARGDSAVVFESLTGSPDWSDDMLSVDDDPMVESHGLLNGKNRYGSYNPEQNLLPKLPRAVAPKNGSCVSLVAAMQRNEAQTSKGGTKQIVGEVVDAYCVVTVMPKAPADAGRDMIRPNVTGVKKEFLTWDDFDLTRIPKYPFLKGKDKAAWQGTARTWRNSIEIFGVATKIKTKRHGMQFRKFSEGGRAFRSHLLVPNYASGTARVFNGNLLSLFASGTNITEAKPALAAMLAYGLDLYHARYSYGDGPARRWSSGAGQSLGTFLPPVFAAALLKDSAKADQLRMAAITNHGDDPGEIGPQELRQIKRGVTGVLLWGDGHPIVRKGNTMIQHDWRYWADFVGSSVYDSAIKKGSANRGKKTAADPYGYIDGPANRPGSSYMSVSFGGFRSLAAAMILMPEIRSVVNTDAPIEYVDRIVRHGLWSWPDPVAAPPEVDQTGCSTWWSAKGCEEWGKSWGPSPSDIRFAIEDGKGRFKSVHGKHVKGGYEVGQASSNWNTIIAMYKGERFEDNAVGLGELVRPEIRFATGKTLKAYMFSANHGTTIRYTTDGSEPTASSKAYQGEPVVVAAGTEIKAKAFKVGRMPSALRVQLPPR